MRSRSYRKRREKPTSLAGDDGTLLEPRPSASSSLGVSPSNLATPVMANIGAPVLSKGIAPKTGDDGDDDDDLDADLTMLNPNSKSLKMTVGQFLEKMRNASVLTTDETYILQEIISYAARHNTVKLEDNNSFSDNSSRPTIVRVPTLMNLGPASKFQPMGAGSPGPTATTDPNLVGSFSTPQQRPADAAAQASPGNVTPRVSAGNVSRQSSGAFGGFTNGSSADIHSHAPQSTLPVAEGNLLVKRTWEITTSYPDCPSLIYTSLLHKFPEATEALFYGVNIDKQAKKLVEMITSGIQLMDKPDMFITVMLQLGSRHVMYAVESQHFDMFNIAVFHTLETALIRKEKEDTDLPPELHWGPVLRAEWTRVLTLMKTVLLQGYTSPQGLALAKKQAVRIKTMLNKCWQSVMKAEDDYEESFVYLLHSLGRSRIGSERADLFTNLVLRHRHFMQMLTHLFDLGIDDDAAKVMLKELGARHVAYRVEESDYQAHAIPFVESIKMRADPKTFNPFVRSQLLLFWKKATVLMVEGAYESTHSFELRYAPKEMPMAMVFTDIESSTSLWEKYPTQMEEAVQQHHRLIRELIHDHHGYEVKTIGDSFMIAFQSLHDAFLLAMRVQVHLLRKPIDEFEMNSTCESSGPDSVWNKNTLRVRIGVHWCMDASPKYDVVHRGYDYYGRDVNAAARIQDVACGGQTVCTEETLTRFRAIARLGEMTPECGDLLTIYPLKSAKDMSFLDQLQKGTAMEVTDEGARGLVKAGGNKKAKASLNDVFRASEYKRDVTLSGIEQAITLYSIYPAVLEDRVYGERKKKVQQDGDSPQSPSKWVELGTAELPKMSKSMGSIAIISASLVSETLGPSEFMLPTKTSSWSQSM